MALVPIEVPPGIVKNNSDYTAGKTSSSEGRYIGGDKHRFQANFPEKLGGWLQVTSGMVGIPRSLRNWRDYLGTARCAIGTETHLYQYDGTTLTDITPLRGRLPGTATLAVSTAAGSTTVAVADATQHLQDGDDVFVSVPVTVGGLTINGWFSAFATSGAGYSITTATAASFTDTQTSAVSYQYPRVQLTNPFTTIGGSNVVTVTDVLNGATTGDYVIVSSASAVGGITLNGEYALTVTSGNTYTIVGGNVASSSTTGGGTPTVAYLVTMQTPGSTATSYVYGAGSYGSGPYSQPPKPTKVTFGGWTLAPYGNLMTAAPIGGEIYIYNPAVGGRAYPLLNAPTTELGHFVTPERFVVALGINNNSLTMAWADQDDFTVWTSTAQNTANSGRTIQGGGYFVGGLGVRDGVSLLFTNRTVIAMTYTGDNEVYATPQISDNSGLISPFAVVVLGGIAYWMSDSEFWMWNGAVSPVPSSDIRDWVFATMNTSYAWKCWAAVQRQHKEVWFFYPSTSATEIDSYVIFHTDQACWSIGTLNRTAGTDADLFPYPLAASPSGVLYYHEIGWDADGTAMDSSVVLSPADISNGDRNMDMFGFIPDFAYQTGTVNLTINTRYYPQDTNAVDGPYAIADDDTTPRIDIRSDGKMIGYELESNVIGGNYRVGVMRADAQAAGARR